jgi:hypothetical protein
MNPGKLKILFFFALIIGCTRLLAQNFTASASRNTVGVGEQFEVSFAINANASGFTPPSFTNLDVYSGPNESTSVEFVNGNVSQSVTFSFIVAAKQEGTATIGAAIVHAGGKTFTSNPITVKVVKGNPPANAQAQSNTTQGSGSSTGNIPNNDVKKNLFVRVIPSKTKAYQGEEILLSIKIYTKLNLTGIDNVTFPEYNGFYSMDAGQKNGQVTLGRENYNGQAYNVATLKQAIVFPERAGNLKIDPASVDCIIAERVRSNNIFDQFFGGSYKNVKYSIKSDPISIQIMPLPPTKNEFSGAVGQFSLKSTLDKTSVKANDAVNLNIVLSGDGNLKLIDSLPITFPPDFDHYDPKITDHITATTSGVSGSRTFNYLVIPRHQGKFTLPAKSFTYFDPQKKNYVTLTIPEFNLDVAKGDNNSATTVAGGVNKEDIRILGQDIRYIHTDHERATVSDSYFLYSVPFYAGIFTPLFAFGLVVFARRRYIEMNKDIIAVKQRGATRMAKKRLKLAYKHMGANNKEAFYEEILKALNGYLGDKLTIPVSELSRETITAKLTERSLKPETLQKLIAALDNCEYARYAPAAVTSNLNEVYDSTVKLITELEDEIMG